MQIPSRFFKKETIYRTIGANDSTGHLSAGFLIKKDYRDYNINMILPVYSGVFVLSGTGSYVDESGQTTLLSPGSFFQRMPGVKHSTYIDQGSNWLEFFICIPPAFFQSMVAMNLPGTQQAVLSPGINIGLLDTFTMFMESLKKSTDAELPHLLCEAQKIIYHLYFLSHHSLSDESQLIHTACILLKNNVTSRQTTEEICKPLEMGYEKFRKLFKQQTGLSPTQYRIQHRINLAKNLLLTADSSIESLAYELGYIDPHTFSKQFKKFTGSSPLQFKRMH